MQEKSLELLAQVQIIIGSYDFALTLRQIYYQLVAKQIIPNDQSAYRKLSRLCVMGRDEGILPEDAFVDRLREVDKPDSWTDLTEYMDTIKDSYRKDIWNEQATYIEIWTEKDALRGVIAPVTHHFDVSLLVVRGQVSRTAIYESYERYAEQIKTGKDCYLSYFGDFDPSGMCIYDSLVERLKSYGPYGLSISYERIALTPGQISAYELPQDPAKQSDPSYRKFVIEYGDNVVELDSLPPDALRDLIRDCIEAKIDKAVLSQVRKIEIEEQVTLENFLAG